MFCAPTSKPRPTVGAKHANGQLWGVWFVYLSCISVCLIYIFLWGLLYIWESLSQNISKIFFKIFQARISAEIKNNKPQIRITGSPDKLTLIFAVKAAFWSCEKDEINVSIDMVHPSFIQVFAASWGKYYSNPYLCDNKFDSSDSLR